MKRITFYLDFISPYAWLAFDKLPEALQGHSYVVNYTPVLLGALLKHHGQRAPAEIAAKRAWIYRHVSWLAKAQGLTLQMPASHPYNPLPLLRLAVACSAQGLPNRYVCEQIFRHVWQGGEEANDPQRLQELIRQLNPARTADSEAAKGLLKTSTDEAIAQGVFGVPAWVVDGKLFWGLDALPMLRAYLDGDAWFCAEWNVPSRVA